MLQLVSVLKMSGSLIGPQIKARKVALIVWSWSVLELCRRVLAVGGLLRGPVRKDRKQILKKNYHYYFYYFFLAEEYY